jgi:hypothetical protein
MVNTGKKDRAQKQSKRIVKSRFPAKEKKRIVPAVEKAAPLIPAGYNIDTVVIMPVNVQTSFVYWEVTGSLLNGSGKKLKNRSSRLMLKVYEGDFRKELCSFEVKEMVGSRYVNYRPSLRPLVAEIGVMSGRGYKGLIRSGAVTGSSDDPSSAEKAGSTSTESSKVWMTKTGGRYEVSSGPLKGGAADRSKIEKYFQRSASPYDNPSSFRKKSGKRE